MRGASGNEEVDWKEMVSAIENFRPISIRTTGDRACADCNHNLWIGHGLICLLERDPHIAGNRTGNQETVRMTRRCHELDPEASQVKHDGIQDVNVRFAPVTAAGAHLPELERSAENAVNVAGKTVGEFQSRFIAQNQVGALARRELVLPAELDRMFRAGVGTLRTKQATPEIYVQTPIAGYRVGGARVDSGFAAGWTSRLIKFWQAPEAVRQIRLVFGEWQCAFALP